MNKILISWIGPADFDRKTQNVSEKSPNLNFNHWTRVPYEKHILITTGDENKGDSFWIQSLHLKNRLDSDFKKREFLLKSFVINPNNLREVNSVSSKILDDYASTYEIHILFSSGTSIISTVWALLSMEKSGTFKLFQGINPIDLKPGQAQFFEISLARDSFGGLMTTQNESFFITPTLQPIYKDAEIVAKYDDLVVLITGENGTGKENLAKYIHQKSTRNGSNYVAVNCSSLSDELLESRLFGHKKGSFTGADRDHTGYFEYASGGTIFLDEIGDISPKMQQSLLRVIQEKKIMKVGDNKEIPVDVRIISATNKDLLHEVLQNKFRQDLYYRINEANLHLPPLRNWKYAEKAELIAHFTEHNETLFNKKIHFSDEVVKKLCMFSYPGNVRQLKAILKNIFVFSNNEVSQERLEILLQIRGEEVVKTREQITRNSVKDTLIQFQGNKTQAAKSLKMSINTFNKYLNTPETE